MAIVMKQDELMQRLDKEFEAMRNDLKIKSSFEELDKVFFLRDYFLKEGYISVKLSRAVCRRIVDFYMGWVGYLHGVILPNPSSMINVTEHNMFDDKEKDDILNLMNTILAHSSRNTLIGLIMDRKDEAKFIDESLRLWKEDVQPKMVAMMVKVNKAWVDKSNEKPSS